MPVVLLSLGKERGLESQFHSQEGRHPASSAYKIFYIRKRTLMKTTAKQFPFHLASWVICDQRHILCFSDPVQVWFSGLLIYLLINTLTCCIYHQCFCLTLVIQSWLVFRWGGSSTEKRRMWKDSGGLNNELICALERKALTLPQWCCSWKGPWDDSNEHLSGRDGYIFQGIFPNQPHKRWHASPDIYNRTCRTINWFCVC